MLLICRLLFVLFTCLFVCLWLVACLLLFVVGFGSCLLCFIGLFWVSICCVAACFTYFDWLVCGFYVVYFTCFAANCLHWLFVYTLFCGLFGVLLLIRVLICIVCLSCLIRWGLCFIVLLFDCWVLLWLLVITWFTYVLFVGLIVEKLVGLMTFRCFVGWFMVLLACCFGGLFYTCLSWLLVNFWVC